MAGSLGYGILEVYPEWRIFVLLGIGLVLLIPGRVQQMYWKGFFRGQKLQLKGRHREALEAFEGFLTTLRERPGLRHLIWFSQGSYARDVEVMTLNNMGVSAMTLRSMKQAETFLKSAAELDPNSPLPYYNLAVLYYGLGDDGHGAANLARAETLGYHKASIRELTRLIKTPRSGKKGALERVPPTRPADHGPLPPGAVFETRDLRLHRAPDRGGRGQPADLQSQGPRRGLPAIEGRAPVDQCVLRPGPPTRLRPGTDQRKHRYGTAGERRGAGHPHAAHRAAGLRSGRGPLRDALSGMNDSAATLYLGRERYPAARAALEPMWTGRYLVLWRPPQLTGHVLGLGAQGNDVLWLGAVPSLFPLPRR